MLQKLSEDFQENIFGKGILVYIASLNSHFVIWLKEVKFDEFSGEILKNI